MSEPISWAWVRDRAAGKWQVPFLVAALGGLAWSLANHRSPLSRFPFEEIRARLPGLIAEGLYTAAIETANQLVQTPERADKEFAVIWAARARARALRADHNGSWTVLAGQEVLRDYEAAAKAGHSLDAVDHELLGRASEWVGDPRSAVGEYDLAIAGLGEPPWELLWRTARLRFAHVGTRPEEFESELTRLLAAAGTHPHVVVWSGQRLLELVCDAGATDRAGTLVSEWSPVLTEAPWSLWNEYLRAYVLFRRGLDDEAEGALRLLRDRLTQRDELWVQTAWLLGRVLLGSSEVQRPDQAIPLFGEAVAAPSLSPLYSAAAELGMAEALAWLERFDESLWYYTQVVKRLSEMASNAVLNAAAVETSLSATSEWLRAAGQFEPALRFAELASSAGSGGSLDRVTRLLEREAELLARVARERFREADPARPHEVSDAVGHGTQHATAEPVRALHEQGRALLLRSAQTYWWIVSLNTLDPAKAEEASWQAVERTRESGDGWATVAAADRFLESQPDSSWIPRASLYKATALQSEAQYARAAETYGQTWRRYPRTLEAMSSLIPLAECHLARGQTYCDEAEKTLNLILNDSDIFTPAAPQYAEALFLLGDLLSRNGSWEQAIPVLEEALERYPTDRRVAGVRFLLGDGYRQSGLALGLESASAEFGGARERLAAERRGRLEKAAKLFGSLIEDQESRGHSALSRLEQLSLQQARLYQADCLFELADYSEALKLYEAAAWVHRGSSAALAAYVQIVNGHVFSGHPTEALAALRRAQYLVETMPEEAFGGGTGPETREDWRDYFAWVERSDLF